MGMILGCIPVAIILYVVGKALIRHMVEEYAPDERPIWMRRDPNSVEGLPHDIRKHH